MPSETTAGRVALFEFDDVAVTRGEAVLLREVSATVPEASITVIAGPSGSGKSTLLRLCNRLEVPSAGVVRFRGEDVGTLDPRTLRRRVGMVFQAPVLFPGTVRDNLAVALPGGDEAQYGVALEAAALAPALLDRDAATLSGGEAQRACLARTLVTEPDVLLLDEPTSALDAAPRSAFEALAIELAAGGLPMLWVTHDAGQLHRVADHVLLVEAGTVTFSGPVARVADDELVRILGPGGS